MNEVALTIIKHGNEDGSVEVFEPGDEVNLPEDVLDELRASGAYGEPTDATGYEAEIERLKAQLEEATARLEASKADAEANEEAAAPGQDESGSQQTSGDQTAPSLT